MPSAPWIAGETIQVGNYRHALFRGLENVFFQHRAGMLSERAWQGYANVIRAQLEGSAEMETWWRENDVIYDPEFREAVAALAGQAPAQQ